MKIYFNQVQENDLKYFGSSELLSPNDSDNYFFNYVEYGTNAGGMEEVAIADSCDRMVPINMEAIPDLIHALETAYDLWKNITFGNALQEAANIEQVEMYVKDSKITFDYKPFQNLVRNT